MVLSQFKRKAAHARVFLRTRGLRYTYNNWWMTTFWNPNDPVSALLGDTVYRKLFPALGWEPFPSMVEIEMTTKCPLRCVICEHTYWNEAPRHMSFEQLRHIVDQFPPLKGTALTGIGENLTNPDFPRMYDYLRKRPGGHGTFVELYDNFYLMNEIKAKEVLDARLDRILVSLDAATPETYALLRPGSDFERVIHNVKRFMALRRQRTDWMPQIIFHFIVTRSNFHEISDYIELARSCGVNSIFVTQMLHRFKEVEPYYMEVPESFIEEANAKASSLGMELKWNLDIHRGSKPDMRLCRAWLQPFIYVTGHVVSCCAMNEANVRDFQKENCLGNVFEQPFREIWYGDRYKEFRRLIRSGYAHPLCKDCPVYAPIKHG